jgi:hypothetical protein
MFCRRHIYKIHEVQSPFLHGMALPRLQKLCSCLFRCFTSPTYILFCSQAFPCNTAVALKNSPFWDITLHTHRSENLKSNINFCSIFSRICVPFLPPRISSHYIRESLNIYELKDRWSIPGNVSNFSLHLQVENGSRAYASFYPMDTCAPYTGKKRPKRESKCLSNYFRG